jgi:hypothetical protein
VIDAVNPSLERAAALADLVEFAFESLEITDALAPGTLLRVSQIIRLEIKDAQALLDAFYNAEKINRQGVQS